jgi:SAM-dependent MidA family methyltransferase
MGKYPAMHRAPLPPPDPAGAAHSAQTAGHLRGVIRLAGGWLPFHLWMAHALYAPGLGYYAAGAAKLASGQAAASAAGLPPGDFVTAPELTPLFAQTLARQARQILQAAGAVTILEFGAGSGALAEGILQALDENGFPAQYRVMEVSADLRQRQQARLAAYGDRVQWLDALPDAFEGCVLANEVLDAMPVALLRWREDGGLNEIGVALAENGAVQYAPDLPASPFCFAERAASAALSAQFAQRMPPLPGYRCEINIQAQAWVREMGRWLRKGAALLIDYGFPAREYYHPQRSEGTLMCHFRHHAHAHPLVLAGLQDITAHVDFTAMAQAARAGGLDVLGYASQARFLMNAGLLDLLAGCDPSDALAYSRVAGPVQRLLSEAEMGELFKVLAVGRGITQPLTGFARGDRRSALEA